MSENPSEDATSDATAKDDGATTKVDVPSTNGTATADADDKAAEIDAKSPVDTPAPEPTSPDPNAPEREVLLIPGNPPRWKRGLIALFAGGVPAFLLMAKNGQNWWAIPLGFLFICVASFGVMDLHGTFDDADDTVENGVRLESLYPALGGFFGLSIAFGATLYCAQAAIFSAWLAAILVPATFLGVVAFVFKLGHDLGPWKTDELGVDRPIWKRHGFWVVVIGTLLYFPLLGVFSLWDPWETHYGEVAREILSRDDWISLWWAQDGWFWSKPVLNFWIQSLAMGSLGTHYHPDMMLIAANGLPLAHPEWVVRTPNVIMAIGAMYALYKGVAKVFGRRAGLIGAIVLATMPQWFCLAHQTMTDMPFVGAMTAAMGLLLYGLNVDEEQKCRTYEIDAFGAKLRFSLWHLVFGAVLLCALPQIIYLLTRNLEFIVWGDGPKGFRIHWDEFKSGSAGNCGIPGNEACVPQVPASLPKAATWWYSPDGGKGFLRFFGAFEPALQGIVWACVLGGALYVNWGERRVRRLVYILAWLCAAIATMAKGPAGFGLPVICAFAYVATKRRWSEILRFEMVTGFLIIFAVALPWYVAMYVRHGSPFTDRLIFHDMFNRAFSHVHDTNEGDDTGIRYYVWQLGYACFPWSGLVAFSLLWGFRRSDSFIGRWVQSATGSQPPPPVATSSATPVLAVGDASVLLVLWFLFTFALFTFMGTKFHHYIFPAVPPAAMLVGVVLDDMLGRSPLTAPGRGRFVLYLAGLTVGCAVSVYGASRLWPGSIFGPKLDNLDSMGTSPALGIFLVLAGIAIFVAVMRAFESGIGEPVAAETIVQDPDKSPFRGGVATVGPSQADERRRTHEQLMLGAAAVAAAAITGIIGRDLARRVDQVDGSGAIRLLQLFTYNYKRPWPDTLDFSAIINAFTLVGVLLSVALAVKRYRQHLVVGFCAFATVWALWGLDVYLMALSPHWGQHELMETYYKTRKGPEEKLVAYQMNWKGENFYTGNHVPAFVSTGASFQTWLKKEKEGGAKVMFLITEHARLGGLKSETGARAYTELTDKTLCNKFVLVRAEF